MICGPEAGVGGRCQLCADGSEPIEEGGARTPLIPVSGETARPLTTGVGRFND